MNSFFTKQSVLFQSRVAMLLFNFYMISSLDSTGNTRMDRELKLVTLPIVKFVYDIKYKSLLPCRPKMKLLYVVDAIRIPFTARNHVFKFRARKFLAKILLLSTNFKTRCKFTNKICFMHLT